MLPPCLFGDDDHFQFQSLSSTALYPVWRTNLWMGEYSLLRDTLELPQVCFARPPIAGVSRFLRRWIIQETIGGRSSCGTNFWSAKLLTCLSYPFVVSLFFTFLVVLRKYEIRCFWFTLFILYLNKLQPTKFCVGKTHYSFVSQRGRRNTHHRIPWRHETVTSAPRNLNEQINYRWPWSDGFPQTLHFAVCIMTTLRGSTQLCH